MYVFKRNLMGIGICMPEEIMEMCSQSWYFSGKTAFACRDGRSKPGKCPDDTAPELVRAYVSVAMPYLQDLDQYFRRPNSWIAGRMWNYILLIVVLVCC
jgi:hypothetical protein